MTSTELKTREARAEGILAEGSPYQIEETHGLLYRWRVSYTDPKTGQPVVYHCSPLSCECPDLVIHRMRRGMATWRCKHIIACERHADTVARFEAMIDATLAEIEALHTAPAHTVYHPIPGFWGLRLASRLSASEIADRIGPALSAKVELESNRQRGYFQDVDPEYPVRLQARVMDLTADERAAILSALGVQEVAR